MPLKKIVVIGPESTGKSSLCEALARHYRTEWVREYAREYLETYGTQYRYEDLSTIARGQLELEGKAEEVMRGRRAGAGLGAGREAGAGLGVDAGVGAGGTAGHEGAGPSDYLFIDTDLYVIKVWSEFVFGRCETWILEEITRRPYDAYLLCCPDLPWAPDPLREYPDTETRERLFHIYKDLLVNQATPWAEIKGIGEERVMTAVAAVQRLTGNA